MKYYIQCSKCDEMVSPMKLATYKFVWGVSMGENDKIAVCEKCGMVEFIVGYEND